MTVRQPYPGVFEQSPSRAEIKAARAQGRAPAVEIAQLCVAAGRPEFAAEAIAFGMTVDQVRRALAAVGVRPDAGSPLDVALAHAKRMTPAAIDKLWDQAIARARGERRH
jgi:hypothetical protein